MKAVAIRCYFELPNEVQTSFFDFPPSASSERDSKLIFERDTSFKAFGITSQIDRLATK
jgi:hypothetical protein